MNVVTVEIVSVMEMIMPSIANEIKNAFSEWWEIYDYRKARTVAERAWLKIDPELFPQIMEHSKQLVQVTHKDGTFPSRPYPATYLNQCRWEDEITPIETEESVRSEWSRISSGD